MIKKHDQRRNNPPQYDLSPFLPQVEEQEGDEPPPMARRRAARCQPRHETRTECLEQRIDMLTELVNTLVVALGQNMANVAPTIPSGILFTNAKGKEVPLPQKGWDAMTNEGRTKTHVRRRCAWCSRHNAP